MFIEDTDKQTETDEATSAETTEEQTTAQTEAETETEHSETEESTKVESDNDISQVTLEELMEREDVQRAIQSVSDRAVAKAEKRLADKAKASAEAARRKAEEDERIKLAEEGDFETLGQREADRIKLTEEFLDHAAKFGVAFTTKMKEQYSPILGEQETERIIDEIDDRQGNIVDLTSALSSAAQEKAVKSATENSAKAVRDELKADIEALKAQIGVNKRSDDVKKGETSSAAVSGTRSETASTEETTYESASIKYGAGDMSWEEFKPFKEQHDKERQL